MRFIRKRKTDNSENIHGAWQRMLDDSIKHANEQREMSEKANYEMEKFRWDCISESATINREKDERMIRIETKLDELLMREVKDD